MEDDDMQYFHRYVKICYSQDVIHVPGFLKSSILIMLSKRLYLFTGILRDL